MSRRRIRRRGCRHLIGGVGLGLGLLILVVGGYFGAVAVRQAQPAAPPPPVAGQHWPGTGSTSADHVRPLV